MLRRGILTGSRRSSVPKAPLLPLRELLNGPIFVIAALVLMAAMTLYWTFRLRCSVNQRLGARKIATQTAKRRRS